MGAVCVAASRTGAFGLIRLVREQIVAQADALAADIDPGANDHALHFVLMLAAKAANQILFVFAGIVICHSCFSLSWIDYSGLPVGNDLIDQAVFLACCAVR